MSYKKIEPRTLPGFMELLPNEQILFNQMKEKIQKSYEKFGFLPLNTPIIEYADVLLAKAGGETEKQIYRFNKGEHDLALRFDLTVPLAKYVAMHYGELSFPFKRYQIGKVYRGERPQKGRFREFYQCDIDIIGDTELNCLYDAELPNVIYTTFQELGFSDFTIHINNRKILNGLFSSLNLTKFSADIMRIIDKIAKIGEENVIKELSDLNIDSNKISIIMNFIAISGTNDEKLIALEKIGITDETFAIGLNELKEVITCMRLFGMPENSFMIDLTIARGLDYYTGTVYETFLNDYPQLGSVCSGGRYDNLAEYYTNKKLPGVGISIGLTRLFYKLNELNVIKTNKNSIADVLVVSASDDITPCLPVATALRSANINTEVYMENKKIKAKFKYADKIFVPFVAIIGETEIETNTISLKNMTTGEQVQVSIDEAIKIIK
jgi:histidyl-tRNA synthetase